MGLVLAIHHPLPSASQLSCSDSISPTSVAVPTRAKMDRVKECFFLGEFKKIVEAKDL